MSLIKQTQLLQELQHAFKQQDGVNQDGNVLLGYSGELHSAVSDSLLLLTENAVVGAGASRKKMHRIGSVLIECLQNVSRHGWINDEGKLDLYLTVELTPLGFQIQCGNLVDIEMAAELRSRLSEVNGLTHEELRVRYVEALCQSELSKKGGAGLGLLSMAKKTNGPLDYHFKEIQQEMYLFTLAVMVKN
ncbi:MAG: SiaB family protein kinase [Flavobacteriales bacterium]|nr:SiaB family protein kinase [Flavobacteriales bacterium]